MAQSEFKIKLLKSPDPTVCIKETAGKGMYNQRFAFTSKKGECWVYEAYGKIDQPRFVWECSGWIAGKNIWMERFNERDDAFNYVISLLAVRKRK